VRLSGTRAFLFVAIVSATIAACGGGASLGGRTSGLIPTDTHAKGSTPIAHVIVLIQENRSFDNLFATFPGADGATSGQAAPMPSPIAQKCEQEGQPVITQPTTVPLTKVSLVGNGFPGNFAHDNDLDHIYIGYQTARDGGKMDGFDLLLFGPNGEGPKATCTYSYQYVDPNNIKPYWDLAKQYVLADHMFQTQASSSFTAHQDLIAGGTVVNYEPSNYGDNSIIDNPSTLGWGCDARSTVTSLISTTLKLYPSDGPKPCFSYKTMRDLLDAKKISWKYYAVAFKAGGAGIWSAFDAIDAVRHSREWRHNVTRSPNDIFHDIAHGRLPGMAWITPDAANSDHPNEIINRKPRDNGPSWIASVVNAIGESKYWKSSAIVILWDDSGGFYDHEPPWLIDDQGGLGFRVPMLIVSPYVQPHVEKTDYEDASILNFIESNWNLGSMGTEEEHRAKSIGNAFNFSQTPRPFQKIQSQYSRSFFLNQKPSNLPVDTE
jgi:phospholipase C